MNYRKLVWRFITIALVAIAAVMIYRKLAPSLAKLTWQDFLMWKPAPAPLIASIVLVIFVNMLHAVLWSRIAVDLGSPKPNLRAAMHIYFVSGLSKYVVKLGQLPGIALLAGKSGMAAGRAATAAVLGQLAFMITGALFVSATLPSIRKLYPRVPLNPALLGLALAAAIVLGTWVLVGTAAGHAFRARVAARATGKIGAKLGSAFAMIDEARPRDALVWALGYTVSWFILAIAFVLFCVAFYAPSAQHARFIAGALAASFVLGNFSPAQAGLGREFAMVLLLEMVMPAHVALIIAVLSRVWAMCGELMPLAFIPLMGKSEVRTQPPAAVVL